ncbi:MAG: DUF3179 domain-containing protein [Motiliproteus sp.]
MQTAQTASIHLIAPLQKRSHKLLLWLFFPLLFVTCYSSANNLNGFDLTDSLIPQSKIYAGGPPRDGIPSIDQPRFIAASEDQLLQPESLVIGVSIDGISRAYPVAILNWHELVNDQINQQPVVISYCPLCGTALVYGAGGTVKQGQARSENESKVVAVGDGGLRFGVSGLLYNSDLLLYDRNTESLWSQITGEAISGPMKGQKLELLPAQLTSWQQWQSLYPQTVVLSTDTGHRRDYRRSPYGDYDSNERIYFPVEFLSRRYHPKERVLGVELNGKYKAYPIAELAKHGDLRSLTDSFGDQQLRIDYDLFSRSGRVFTANGVELPVINAYWFAWYGFHPKTAVYTANSK